MASCWVRVMGQDGKWLVPSAEKIKPCPEDVSDLRHAVQGLVPLSAFGDGVRRVLMYALTLPPLLLQPRLLRQRVVVTRQHARQHARIRRLPMVCNTDQVNVSHR